MCYLWRDLHKPHSSQRILMRILCLCVCVCLPAHAPELELESLFGNSSVHLDSRRVNVCLFLCVCVCEREETKIEAAHWVKAHAYAWTHSPPVRSWLTHTCQRFNSPWHTPLQPCNAVQQRAVWGWPEEVCLLHVCLLSMEFMKELRDQTAADGVCLAIVLALLYPVGQYNWRFLSHQVFNSCCPTARDLSKCECGEIKGR